MCIKIKLPQTIVCFLLILGTNSLFSAPTSLSEKEDTNFMDQKQIINRYFQGLEKASYEDVISLFAKNAIVFSPLYGQIEAVKFYREIFAVTNNSKITLKNIFISPDNPKVAAAHFYYDWTLKDGTPAPFECIDIFEFSSGSNQVTKLTIIYDTFHTRKAFEEANTQH
jgi:hypothetical protein